MADKHEHDPFAGQDALSLPDRPAHPDPSKGVDDVAGYDKAPIHGIVGFHEYKHGIQTKAELEASLKDKGVPAGNALAEAVESGDVTMVDSTPDSRTVEPRERSAKVAQDRKPA